MLIKTEKFIFPAIPAAPNQLALPREVTSVQNITNKQNTRWRCSFLARASTQLFLKPETHYLQKLKQGYSLLKNTGETEGVLADFM